MEQDRAAVEGRHGNGNASIGYEEYKEPIYRPVYKDAMSRNKRRCEINGQPVNQGSHGKIGG